MTTTPPVAPSRSRELLITCSTGVLFAAALGLGAAVLRGEQFWLVFGVLTACFLAPCITLAWLLLGAGR
jgi:hypothetical protein